MVTYKIQAGFFPKWDETGEPTGPAFWEDEPNGGGFNTNEEARTAMINLCTTCGYDPDRFRIVPEIT